MGCELLVCNGAKHFDINSTIRHESYYFNNGELYIKIYSSVRGKSVCILQSFELPNTHFMELCLTVDAVKRAGAKSITVISPYFPYCRMDKKHAAGVPISAKVVCDMLASVNIDRLVTFDLHNDAIQGFLSNNIQFDHLLLRGYFKQELEKVYGSLASWVFCAPDAGSVKRVKKFATLCGSNDMCIGIKTRPKDGKVSHIQMIGDVKDRDVIVADDMCDTGGTLVKIMDLLEANGAHRVIAVTTHPIFSYPSYEVLRNRTIYVSNSCKISQVQYKDRYIRQGNPVTLPDTVHVIELEPFLHELLKRLSMNSKIGDMIDFNG